ncbi:MAG: CPCC family cysteine-rich protein [Planctomycetota bacterium]
MAASTAASESRDCPVCGLESAFDEPGAYGICGRCGWEDDPAQLEDPDFPGGANGPSLNQARRSWQTRSGRG